MVWLVVMLALMIPLIAVVLDSSLGRAIAGRLEHNRHPGGDDGANKRLAQLESEVERLNGEVARLDEETTFLHKLLEAKPDHNALPPGDREA